MSLSDVLIRRPIGTILLSIGLFLVGAFAYTLLPVASLPSVDLPVVLITTSYPGAEPNVMASTVAAPIERRLGEIAGVTELTSTSSLGSSNIIVQFDLSRNVDGAARDVEAALNAAATDLPSDLPQLPTFRKLNPAAAPVLILALTSDTIPPTGLYDAADTVLAQRISQVEGVAEVDVAGAEQPAVRVRADPAQLASMGVSMDDIRTTIVNANALSPTGLVDGGQGRTIDTNGQLNGPPDYQTLVVKTENGGAVLLSSVATIDNGVRNIRSSAWFDGKPAVLIQIRKEANANVIETVDRVLRLLPDVKRFVPADLQFSVLNDRTTTIRASVADMQRTLLITVLFVMAVILVFLRRVTPTVAAGVTVPLALSGTCALMWAAGFSIDNISLMALAVSVGFVVDDAIVIIENVDGQSGTRLSPIDKAIAGVRQIGFTVVSISVSLIAAFIPLLLMGGIVGRFFREFSLTLVFTILISTVVSLTLTPMILAHFGPRRPRPPNRFDRGFEGALAWLIARYATSLKVVLRHRALTLLVMVLTIVATVVLFVKTPKGFFPEDDTGLLTGSTEAATDVSFAALSELQQRVAAIVGADPAVAGVGSSIGGTGGPGGTTSNQGKLFISLKSLADRDNLPTARVIDRLRQKLSHVAGMNVYLVQQQDLRAGARQGKSQYQFTLWDTNFDELVGNVPAVVAKLKTVPGLTDVSTDREAGGLQANVVIDRQSAARLGVSIQSIDDALNNAFSQRQISTIYSARNQYRVILEVDPKRASGPTDLKSIFVPGTGGTQVRLDAVSHLTEGFAPLVTNHQGQFPAVTITYNLKPDAVASTANEAILAAVASMHLPDSLHAEFAGDASQLNQSAGAQQLLLITALVAVYIVLGVLYESLVHPLTIISTLPSAGLGALLALQWTRTELSLIAFIGIVLLIGIVKKNGIMLVDFALAAERGRHLAPVEAIYEACLERFRPILMTTLAALLGALPLVMATGPGSGLRRPLGITIVGGLIVSQVLTLYTTPVIYLLLSGASARVRGWTRPRARPAAAITGS